jgi:hypothetical protein
MMRELNVKLATEVKYSSLEPEALDYVAMYTCRLLPKFQKSAIIISPFLPRGCCQTLNQKLHNIPDFKRKYSKHASWLNFQSPQNKANTKQRRYAFHNLKFAAKAQT